MLAQHTKGQSSDDDIEVTILLIYENRIIYVKM